MKKNIFGLLILVLFSMLLFNSYCKKTEEILQKPKGLFVITDGIGKVMYFHYEDFTYLVMQGRVLSQNEISGTITSWKFIFKSGNTELLEINDANYSSYNLFTYGQLRIFANNVGTVNVSYIDKSHENFFPFHGKLFDANPDNMDIFITITDDNANIQTIEFNTTVTFDLY
jgi:hypothetical protein